MGKPIPVSEAQASELWPLFAAYADDVGINLNHVDDWEPSWECWYDGFQAAEKLAEQKDNPSRLEQISRICRTPGCDVFKRREANMGG